MINRPLGFGPNGEAWTLLVSHGGHTVGPRGQKVQESLFCVSSLCHSWRGLITLQTAVHHRVCLLLGFCLEIGPSDSALNIYLTGLTSQILQLFPYVVVLQHQVDQALSSLSHSRAARLWQGVGLETPPRALPAQAALWACGHVPGQETGPDKQRIRRKLAQLKPNSPKLMGHRPCQTNLIFRLGFFLAGVVYAATLSYACLSSLSYLLFPPRNFWIQANFPLKSTERKEYV